MGDITAVREVQKIPITMCQKRKEFCLSLQISEREAEAEGEKPS
jgi:hypothetical protein